MSLIENLGESHPKLPSHFGAYQLGLGYKRDQKRGKEGGVM